MAIDDNTSYELTGYQVKDLAGRIRLKADASAIPTVNDATLTLTQDGTTVGTFTANQSTDTTINLAGGAIETVGSGDNICYKFPDGLMIAVVKKTASVTWGAWAGWYESQAIDPPNFAQAFTAVPFCVAGLISGGQAAIGIGTGRTGTGTSCTATRGQSVVLMRPNDVSQSFTVCWQAIGRWK